jgi:hypothetical protein
MGRRDRNDRIDGLCREWAVTRRQLLGLDDPVLSRDYVGAMRSTLGQRRDLHAGAKSDGRVEQHFPEVYIGAARLVNNAWRTMRPALKITMDVHYCARGDANEKADFLCISRQTYWNRVRDVRTYVESRIDLAMDADLNIDTRGRLTA